MGTQVGLPEHESAVAGDLINIMSEPVPAAWDPAMAQTWKWPGDHVKKGETICEIQTDMMKLQIPSPATGIVKEWFYRPNDMLYTGGKSGRIVIGTMLPTGETQVGLPEHESAVAGGLINIMSDPVPAAWDPAMAQTWKWPGDHVKKGETICEIQ